MATLYSASDYGGTTQAVWVVWASSTSSSTDIWPRWCSTTATTATSGTHVVWQFWCDGSSYTPIGPGRELTDEERAELERRRQEQIEDQRRRELERKAAAERARKLLLDALDGAQQEELERDGHFHVHTADGLRTYRLKPGARPLLVPKDDRPAYAFCIHPDGGWPADDVALAQKLMLETDEDAFLRIANRSMVTLTNA